MDRFLKRPTERTSSERDPKRHSAAQPVPEALERISVPPAESQTLQMTSIAQVARWLSSLPSAHATESDVQQLRQAIAVAASSVAAAV